MSMLSRVLRPLASLRLTVVSLALAMLLVLAGTLAQSSAGNWAVQKKYFYSWVCLVPLNVFIGGLPGSLPMPGGFGIGALFVVNLVAAHAMRFQLSWRRVGVILIHAGMILLLLGGLVAALFQVESLMAISEGQYATYSYDVREAELAIVDRSPAEHDTQVVIAGWKAGRKGTIRDSRLPFELRIDHYWPNADLAELTVGEENLASAGMGLSLRAVPKASFAGTGSEAGKVDAAAAYVTPMVNGQPLGTYLLGVLLRQAEEVVLPDGKRFLMQLRFRRYYKPYQVHLLKFRFDRYTGTNIAKNFSSQVRLVDERYHEDRQALIWMNHPLYYRGEKFFQADWDKETERGTVLQVVDNPAWFMPYVSCTVITLGLIVHFVLGLVQFLGRRKAAEASGGRWNLADWLVPAGATAACALFLLLVGWPAREKSPYNLSSLGAVPISYDGRTMPLDTLARSSLKVLSGRETFRIHDTGGDKSVAHPATRWLADVLALRRQSLEHRVFRIDHDELLDLLNLDTKRPGRFYSAGELMDRQQQLQEKAVEAFKVEARDRDLYQRKLIELYQRMELLGRLVQVGNLYAVPPLEKGQDWQPLAGALGSAGGNPHGPTSAPAGPAHPAAEALVNILQAYHEEQPEAFNQRVAGYHRMLQEKQPAMMDKVRFEVAFNRYAPFYWLMPVYVAVFLLCALAWVAWTPTLLRAAFWVLLLTFVCHSLALVGRIYLQGRPPVTNLYSSAIFIAWGGVVLGAIIEWIFRNGIGTASAAVLGFVSLLIAHNLSFDGDTMRMLQAVLDTNFWLATHVLTITFGYSTTFVAGLVGIAWVLGGLLVMMMPLRAGAEASGAAAVGRALSRIAYGVVCFSLLFSFVGTVLGGIWADQSWGRFWGWDPKENGAILLVLWLALVLHARWAGWAGQRGVVLLSIFGNVVTAWSWFGTNMLGIGLHSYGFMDRGFWWLVLFVLSQLLLIGVGMLPLPWWQPAGAAQRELSPVAASEE